MAEAAEEEIHGAALDDDGENDYDVGGGEDPGSALIGRDGECEGDGEASAKAAPAEGYERALVVALYETNRGEEKGDDGEADDVDGYDGDEAGLKGLTVNRDGEDLDAEENEED